jgi:hypothetical protein
MPTYVAHVARPSGGMMKVEVQADNPLDAKDQIEAQYGKENVRIPPVLK